MGKLIYFLCYILSVFPADANENRRHIHVVRKGSRGSHRGYTVAKIWIEEGGDKKIEVEWSLLNSKDEAAIVEIIDRNWEEINQMIDKVFAGESIEIMQIRQPMCKYKDINVSIKKIDFSQKRGKMAVFLSDGREILVPVGLFPEIKKLSMPQRRDYMIMDDQYFTFEAVSKIYSIKDILHSQHRKHPTIFILYRGAIPATFAKKIADMLTREQILEIDRQTIIYFEILFQNK